MKTLGIILLGLAIASALSGLWCATTGLSWAACEAWMWNDGDEMED